MSDIAELTIAPSATDGEIAAINLESARRAHGHVSRRTRAARALPRQLSITSVWRRNFSATWTHSTVWMRSPGNSSAWTLVSRSAGSGRGRFDGASLRRCPRTTSRVPS